MFIWCQETSNEVCQLGRVRINQITLKSQHRRGTGASLGEEQGANWSLVPLASSLTDSTRAGPEANFRLKMSESPKTRSYPLNGSYNLNILPPCTPSFQAQWHTNKKQKQPKSGQPPPTDQPITNSASDASKWLLHSAHLCTTQNLRSGLKNRLTREWGLMLPCWAWRAKRNTKNFSEQVLDFFPQLTLTQVPKNMWEP